MSTFMYRIKVKYKTAAKPAQSAKSKIIIGKGGFFALRRFPKTTMPKNNKIIIGAMILLK